MEEKKNIHLGAAMNYGLIMGVAMVLFSFLTKTSNTGNPLNSTTVFIGFLSIFLYIYGIYYFSKRYRTKHLNGFMTYGMGLKLGTLIILFASIIVGFYNYIDCIYFDSNLLDNLIKQKKEFTAQFLYKFGSPDSVIENELKKIDENPSSPAGYAFETILSYTFWGFIISLITARMLLKKPNPFEETSNNNQETN